jgi:hypothetical protein
MERDRQEILGGRGGLLDKRHFIRDLMEMEDKATWGKEAAGRCKGPELSMLEKEQWGWMGQPEGLVIAEETPEATGYEEDLVDLREDSEFNSEVAGSHGRL